MRLRGWVLALAAGPVLAGLAACGGGERGSGVASAGGGRAAQASVSPSRSLSPEDAQLRFARCLRDNGVDVPDPKPGRDFRMEIPRRGDTKKLQAAMEKCRHFLEATGKLPDLNDPETRDKLVRFARCARQNGIDIPDPVGEDGLKGVMQNVDRTELEKARELCGHLLPGRNG